MDLNDRLTVIDSIETFLTEKTEELSCIISSLNWSEEYLSNEEKVQCPNDPNHWVSKSGLEKHIEKCSWVKGGYVPEEFVLESMNSNFFYEKAPSVIPVTIDKEKQHSILKGKGLLQFELEDCKLPDNPKTVDRWCTELNPEQRLAIYDYIVEEGKSAKQSTNVALDELMFDFEKKNDQNGKPKTALEIMAEQRDYKRRRQSYRAKNVHITKKSYTEVMKEVIENQISFLVESRKQESLENEDNNTDNTINDLESVNSHRSRKRRHSSESRSRSKSPKKHNRSRSRSASPKRHKHKHKRSRSRSRNRHKHKKSHKHRKSYD